MKEIELNYNNRKFLLDVERCSFFGRFRGLMFRSKRNSSVLLFEFSKPTRASIHSLFVFFEFIAIFTDDKNNILEIKRVKPFSFSVSCSKKFSKLVEVPINEKFDGILGILDEN